MTIKNPRSETVNEYRWRRYLLFVLAEGLMRYIQPASRGSGHLSETKVRQRLAAILAADAVGYSRLMATDERGTVAALDEARAVFRRHVEGNGGRVVDMAGDSVLAVFDLATGAVSAALAIQQRLTTADSTLPEQRRMRFRIGLHIGEIIEKPDGTIYGDGVNIAARLQALAEPSGITCSDSVHTAVRGRVAASFDDAGDQTVKNIPQAVRVFRVMAATPHQDKTAIARAAVSMSAPVPGFDGRPAIAVLPFANMSGDPDQDYFADGLAEDLLTRLAMWRWFPVIARNSSFTFRGRNVDIKEVGRALGAQYVLEGSVRKAADRVRVTGQLIDAETGHHLWADRYDRKLEDIFAIQDELTDGIANALQTAIGRSELERARYKAPANLDAWDASQRGWWHVFRFTREDFAAAEPLFRRAIELDPRMAQSFTGLAFLRMFQGFFLWSPPQTVFPESVQHARAALANDPRDALACGMLGTILGFTGKLDEAVTLGARAVDLNPSGFIAFAGLAATYLWRGEPSDGIRAGERAIRISPDDTVLHTVLGTLSANHYMARQFERAVEIAKLAVQRAPHYPIGWRSLANALAQCGRLVEAKEALGQFLKLMPNYATEGAARASVGFRDEALFQYYLEGLRKAGWQG